jgi:nicotinamide riboside kinase
VAELGRGLVPGDLAALARLYRANRARALRVARAKGKPGILLDTDFYSSWVYAEHYMGAAPAWLKRSARRGAADLYLYCEADIPLVAEPGQRGSAEDRRAVDRGLSGLLALEGQRVISVGGSRTQRVGLAMQAITAVLAEGANAETPGPL